MERTKLVSPVFSLVPVSIESALSIPLDTSKEEASKGGSEATAGSYAWCLSVSSVGWSSLLSVDPHALAVAMKVRRTETRVDVTMLWNHPAHTAHRGP